MNTLITNEKHYVTLNNYLRNTYHKKIYKISLNGGFSCPNRDGTLSTKGCIFCSALGSGDFAGNVHEPLLTQFQNIQQVMAKKWADGDFIAYFQANTNTYASVASLRKKYEEIVPLDKPINPRIKILSIATRPDCLSDEIIDLLAEFNKKIPVWVELGLQSIHENTALWMNRGYHLEVFKTAVNKLHQKGITIIVHLINGFPNESFDEMIENAKFLTTLPIQGVKFHMLCVLKNTPLEKIYKENPFKLLTLEEYVKVCVKQIEYLKDTIVIHRLTGDAPKELLIAPLWTNKKFVVIDEIDKYMRKNNLYQGDLVE